jgi:hypothetical protein
MAMQFDLLRNEELPPLAWLLFHERGKDRARVLAGADVRLQGASAFWEGINPAFERPELTPLHHFPLCTGCITRGEEIVAFTPGHIFDRLFLIRDGDRLLLSNSLPFVLRAAGTRLNPRDLLYAWRFGVIQAHRQTAPLERGKLEFFHNTNIVIGRDHRIELEAKPASPDFNNFAEYREGLDAYLREISDALQGQTGARYEPVSTISSGYDSAAAAVLARSIGAKRALTISDSRYGEAGDDSGAAIGERLGLEVTTRGRTDYRQHGIEAERLFYTCGLPEDIIFHAFADDVRRTLLFTGHKGDTMWAKHGRPVGSWSLDPGGATMQCFRLRMNFVHFPPAFFGWARHKKVLEISQSEEMAPWSLGNSYDRPIPRRIVEEAGIPRDWFGMEKRAVSAMYGLDNRNYVAPEELGVSREFADLLRQHRQRWRSIGVDLGIGAGNCVHSAMRLANRALSKKKGSGGGGSPRATSLKTRLTMAMDHVGNIHRAFWLPFTDLTFAPQVANELLAHDYPPPERILADNRATRV